MGAQELRLPSGITTLRANTTGEHVVIGISATEAPTLEMIAIIDRGQSHMLMIYLADKLGYSVRAERR